MNSCCKTLSQKKKKRKEKVERLTKIHLNTFTFHNKYNTNRKLCTFIPKNGKTPSCLWKRIIYFHCKNEPVWKRHLVSYCGTFRVSQTNCFKETTLDFDVQIEKTTTQLVSRSMDGLVSGIISHKLCSFHRTDVKRWSTSVVCSTSFLIWYKMSYSLRSIPEFYILAVASRGQMRFWAGKNSKICRKLLILAIFFFWLGASGGRASDWGKMPPCSPPWCRHCILVKSC